MDNIKHEIELYSLEKFKTLLEHEIRKSRRYKHSICFIHLAVEADPETPQSQHGAEMIAISALDTALRDTDIPCRHDHEFFVLLTSTDENGGRIACARLEKLLNVSAKTPEGFPFQMSAFMGLASIYDDLLLESTKLMEEASKAMNHARTNRLRKTVAFSELK